MAVEKMETETTVTTAGQEEEEPIVYSSSSEDEDSEDETRVKKAAVNVTSFNEDFTFEATDTDPWSQYFTAKKLKKRLLGADIDLKLPKGVKAEGPLAKKAKRGEVIDVVDSDDDGCIDSEDDLVGNSESAVDKLNIRKKDVKKKEKQNKRKPSVLVDAEAEEGAGQYFEDAPLLSTDATFQEMNLSRPLLKAIESMNYNNPTPIQASTIPVALLGKDICGCAATGTGKTAAFMLPLLERLLYKPTEDVVTRVLVLVPTRELGVQVFEVGKSLARFSTIDLALSVGGLDVRSQEANLRRNPDIVIATPGRLIDHLKNTPSFSLDRIEILVLDEADRMLDEYFAEQMKEIINQCSRKRQTLLFSATMSTEVTELAAVSLKNPVKIFVNSNKSVAQNLRQEFVKIKKNEEGDREAVLAYLICRTFHEQCIVFIQTKAMCHRLLVLLSLMEVRVGELHGNLSQIQRLEALQKFKDGEIGILLCTDLAARGLDIPHVRTVINFTLPGTYQNYVHRVGRTARAGHCGRSISLVGEQEYKALKQIKKSSNTVVYERQPNKAVLLKFKKKIEKLNSQVRGRMTMEKEAREIRALENSVNGMEKKLHANPEDIHKREWFQTHKERLKEKKRQMILEKPTKKGKKKDKPKKPQISEQEQRLLREIDIAQKVAKRAQRGIGVKGAYRDNQQTQDVNKKKVQGKVSIFDKDLTRTDRKSVKRLRSGPSYQERKQSFAKKNPGKKYKHKK